MKAGTFDAYPSHSADPYRGGRMLGSRDMGAGASLTGKYFIPSPGPKSAPSTSVLDQNVVRFTARLLPLFSVREYYFTFFFRFQKKHDFLRFFETTYQKVVKSQ